MRSFLAAIACSFVLTHNSVAGDNSAPRSDDYFSLGIEKLANGDIGVGFVIHSNGDIGHGGLRGSKGDKIYNAIEGRYGELKIGDFIAVEKKQDQKWVLSRTMYRWNDEHFDCFAKRGNK